MAASLLHLKDLKRAVVDAIAGGTEQVPPKMHPLLMSETSLMTKILKHTTWHPQRSSTKRPHPQWLDKPYDRYQLHPLG